MNRREFLTSNISATALSVAKVSGPIIPPRSDIEPYPVRSGNCRLDIRAELLPGTLTLTYLYITIVPLSQRLAKSRRPITADLHLGEILEPDDSTHLNFRKDQEPIRTIAITHEGLIYRLTGNFWLLVNQELVLGEQACAPLSEVPPKGQVCLTLAEGSWANIEILKVNQEPDG